MARMIVLGASGSGKSWYAGAVLEQAAPQFDYAIHFDPEDEEVALSAPAKATGYPPLYRRLPVSPATYQRLNLLKAVHRNERVRVVPEGLTTDEMSDLYGICAAVAMKLAKDMNAGTVLVSCDEAHNVVHEGSLDERIERLVTGGRKHGAEVCHVSQRPQLVHKTLLSQTDKAVYFRLGEDNDLKKIDKQSAVPSGEILALDKRECIVEDRDSGDWTLVDTERDVTRQRPHFSGDDGQLDEKLPV